MLTELKDSPLYLLAKPRSLAFFGASNSSFSMGVNLFLSNRDIGFKGPLYPVHPQDEEVHGYKAYKSALDLPEAPDAAVVVVPTKIVPQVVDECGQRGIKRAIIVSGGFKEVGPEGAALEKELVGIARKYGLRFLGPNCLGVANTHHKVNTTFMPHEGGAGFIGLASQSGSLITQMFGYLSKFGLNYSTAFSVGNEADLDLVDCLEYLGADPETKVIALYIEGLKRGREFLRAAAEITPHKPIVAYYAGGSETGQRAGLSHTGALAGPDGLYDGLFRQAGVVRAATLTELYDFCWLLASQPCPRGNRVVIQTHSGGPGVAAADACERAGLEVPPLSARTFQRLADHIPHTGSRSNPVDITFSRNQLDFFHEIPSVLLEDEATDMLLIYIMAPAKVIERTLRVSGLPEDEAVLQGRRYQEEQCQRMVDVIRGHDKPVVGFTYRDYEDASVQGLIDRGVPVLLGSERAARAMAALASYARLREKLLSNEVLVSGRKERFQIA
ncbi:MAG: CoA-binding protein [Pseudomonadota bacterium]